MLLELIGGFYYHIFDWQQSNDAINRVSTVRCFTLYNQDLLNNHYSTKLIRANHENKYQTFLKNTHHPVNFWVWLFLPPETESI